MNITFMRYTQTEGCCYIDRTEELLSIIRANITEMNKDGINDNSIEMTTSSFSLSQFDIRVSEIGVKLESIDQSLIILSNYSKHMGLLGNRSRDVDSLVNTTTTAFRNTENDITKIAEIAKSSYEKNVLEGIRLRVGTISRKFKDILEKRQAQLISAENRRNRYTSNTSLDLTIGAQAVYSQAYDDLEENNFEALTQIRGGGFLQNRASAMEGVQRTISELGQIFTRISEMVNQQDELILRIDDDLDRGKLNLGKGQLELLKFYRNIFSSRNFVIKIFATLIVFMIIYMNVF